jgi:predicted phosphodiesterase
MNILILSDLHLSSAIFSSSFHFSKQKRIIKGCLKNLDKADLVVISGDVVESSVMNTQTNPLNLLYMLFEKPVIFCLGNHEFAYRDHSEVIKYWSSYKHENVHCLDIEGHFSIGNYNFVGNVLWYDFSLNKNTKLMKGEILDGWLDSTIKNFDPLIECQKCKEQILNNLSKDLTNILVTHMVPHKDLNYFSIEEPYSPWNAYSGCERFLLDCQDAGFNNIEYAICGHTHQKEYKEIWGINCINIGNDYYHRCNCITSMMIEL